VDVFLVVVAAVRTRSTLPAIKVINENSIQTAGPLIFFVGR
jgi:hypothetical protein